MPEQDEVSSLEQVRRTLYDPKATPHLEVPHLSERPVSKPTGWQQLRRVEEESAHMSGPARFFIVALIFFVVTGAGATAYLLYGGRSVSTNNVTITVQGPTSISSGDSVPLLVTIENHNPVPIRTGALFVEFPDGTKSADDPTQPLIHYTEDVGNIPAGGKVERTVRAVMFGAEGSKVSLPIKVQYRTDSSNSVFIKDKSYEFTVTTSPLSLTVSSLSQVSSGQPVTIDVVLRSNAATPLQNVAVVAVYPFGFQPTKTTPAPTAGTLFAFGTLAPGEQRTISITGVLSGENNDARAFKFEAGTVSDANATSLATSYSSKETDIKLTKPFLATSLTVNHDSTESPVMDSGVSTQAMISWVNTLASQITNGQITIALSGDALDPSSVAVGSGFYRSSDTTVIFSSENNQGLKSLQPGDTGQGTFTFSTKKGPSMDALRSPSITMRISVAGRRNGEANVPQTIASSVTRVVKIATNLGLASKVVYTSGPFKNTGPWPPEPNKETTYTVSYALTNTVNNVAGAQVTATLPSYVRFTGKVYPTDGSITYNESSRTVTWNAGDIPAGQTNPKLASFQVAITPSVSQSNSSPVLVFTQQVTGTDRFTQRQITGSVHELTTQTNLDPAYNPQNGSVK